jgi:atypical dual specificity phosphatase
MGRTGTILAAWLVSRGQGAGEAIALVRSLRPGSIETRAQEESVRRFAELMGVDPK